MVEKCSGCCFTHLCREIQLYAPCEGPYTEEDVRALLDQLTTKQEEQTMSHQERCNRICKGSNNCFILNKEHLSCVADYVINKAGPVREFIRMAIEENKCPHVKEILYRADNSLTDLIAWVQHLRTSRKEKEILWG